MNAVWRHSQASDRKRLVLLAIADHQGEIGAWPSIATLAKMCNASERSVQRDIKELEFMGELIIETQNAPVKSQYKSNLYWVNLPGVTNQASGVTDSTSGVTDSAIRGDTVVVQNQRTITEPLQKETRLPKDWYPNDSLLQKFATKWPLLDPDYNIEQFVLFWHSVNKKKIDWDLTFINWMNKEQKHHESRGNKPQPRSQAGVAKSEKERQFSEQFLKEQEEMAKNAAPAPKCEHDKNVALCNICLNR
jgi:hypothetical protein